MFCVDGVTMVTLIPTPNLDGPYSAHDYILYKTTKVVKDCTGCIRMIASLFGLATIQ